MNEKTPLPLFLSMLVAAASPSAAAFPNSSTFQGFASSFETGAKVLISTVDGVVLVIGTAVWSLLIILGVVLWFSRANRHLGKSLVEGGIIIALFITFVVPFIMGIKLPIPVP